MGTTRGGVRDRLRQPSGNRTKGAGCLLQRSTSDSKYLFGPADGSARALGSTGSARAAPYRLCFRTEWAKCDNPTDAKRSERFRIGRVDYNYPILNAGGENELSLPPPHQTGTGFLAKPFAIWGVGLNRHPRVHDQH